MKGPSARTIRPPSEREVREVVQVLYGQRLVVDGENLSIDEGWPALEAWFDALEPSSM